MSRSSASFSDPSVQPSNLSAARSGARGVRLTKERRRSYNAFWPIPLKSIEAVPQRLQLLHRRNALPVNADTALLDHHLSEADVA
jgi:hypothetical protein